MTRNSAIEEIAEELKVLSHDAMLAYGLSCAERLFPNYLKFSRDNDWGDSGALREALDAGWAKLAQEASPHADLEEIQKRCFNAAPDTETFSHFASAGLDAATAAYHLLEFLKSRDPEEILTIVHLCLDTVEMHLRNSFFQDATIRSPEDLERFSMSLEERVAGHPLMIGELQRLKEDLNLATISNPSSLRERWRQVPTSNLQVIAVKG